MRYYRQLFYTNHQSGFTGWHLLALLTIGFVVAMSIAIYHSGNYNNYWLYSRPFLLLKQHESLYLFHPGLYNEIYNYSPFFAFAMGAFTYLPNEVGIVLWNLLSVLVLLGGIQNYFATERQRNRALLLLFPVILLSAGNLHSSTLTAGLILLNLSLLKQQKLMLAALLIALCFILKAMG